jgi:hypothetical protein
MDDDRQIMRGNGDGLLEFLERAIERGDMNKETARGFRSASRQILEIESDDLASIDVRRLDIEDLLDRFVNLKRADFGDGSLDTYKSRFRRSVAMYVAWLNGDTGWKTAGLKPGARQTPRQTRRKQATKIVSVEELLDSSGDNQPVSSHRAPDFNVPATEASGSRLMTYDVPLRQDLVVRVTLPLDLTTEDAERFAKFINALAFSPSRSGSENTNSTEGGE